MILDDYLIILEAEKGYSAHTLRAYFTDIKSFIFFIWRLATGGMKIGNRHLKKRSNR